jgi:hypothetical protein
MRLNFASRGILIMLVFHYSKFYGKILVSFEFRKFQTHNLKGMAKDKKSQYCSYLV